MWIMEQARVGTAEPRLQSARHVGGRDTVERCLIQIYFHVVLGLRVFDVPVHIHDTWRLLKDLLDLRRQFNLSFVVRSVHFGHQSLQYWRTRRDFRYLDARTEGRSNLVQFRPQSSCDLVALRLAIVAREQIHLDISLIGLIPQEIMAHQTVEVVRARCPSIYLIIDNLWLLAEILSQSLRHAGCLFQRRAIRHVNHDLELTLVVRSEE